MLVAVLAIVPMLLRRRRLARLGAGLAVRGQDRGGRADTGQREDRLLRALAQGFERGSARRVDLQHQLHVAVADGDGLHQAQGNQVATGGLIDHAGKCPANIGLGDRCHP
jgi:hypothetical protein